MRIRWVSVPDRCGQLQPLAGYLFPGGSVLTASSMAQVEKEQAPRPSKTGCFLTETKLRLSKCILVFSFSGYGQSFIAWSHQLKYASLSRKGFMLKFLALSKRKMGWFKLPRNRKVFIYVSSNHDCCFSLHCTVRYGRDLTDLWLFEPCSFKNRAHHSQANTHLKCTLMSCKRSEVVEGKPRAQRTLE